MPTLVFYDSDGSDRTFEMGREPVLIGRAAECQIQSTDPRVSRRHARLLLGAAGACWIEDLGSANGVYVAGQRVSSSPIAPGQVVVVGSLIMQLAPDATADGSYGHDWTLSSMLKLERKARSTVEEERSALANRV